VNHLEREIERAEEPVDTVAERADRANVVEPAAQRHLVEHPELAQRRGELHQIRDRAAESFVVISDVDSRSVPLID
jgi:DNA-binding ferritin-like protein